MSAFGQAGFGSRNRQNQLRAQGQMDPYGNQVRQAKQAPTFNIYNQQPQASSPQPPRPSTPSQQPTSMPAYGGQPQAGGPTPTSPGVTQPSTPPAQPQTGGPFPTYDSVMGPQTGGPMPTMGQAQAIPPTSTGTPYQQAPADDGFQKWSGMRAHAAIKDPNQAEIIAKMEREAVQQWQRMTPAQRAWHAANPQSWSPQYATRLEEAYAKANEADARASKSNEISNLRRQLAGGWSSQDDDILYRLNTLEGGQPISREDFIRQRQAGRDDAPRAAQFQDREKFMAEWMNEKQQATMSPKQYQQSRNSDKQYDDLLRLHMTGGQFQGAAIRGVAKQYSDDTARRLEEMRNARAQDLVNQEQFLAGWQGPRPFEEWYAQRYGEDAKQKWNLL